MSLQERFDASFEAFERGDLSREDYVAAIQSTYDWLPRHYKEFVDKRVGFRRDGRALGEFALHLYDTTRREAFVVQEWVKLIDGARVDNYGIANDGRLVLATHGKSRRADYALTTEKGVFPLEIKFGPSVRHVTYKVSDLEGYAKVPGLHVLTVIWPEDQVCRAGELPPGIRWFCMREQQLLHVLHYGERGPHSGFGGKMTVRVYAEEFREFFRVKKWTKLRQRTKVAQ